MTEAWLTATVRPAEAADISAIKQIAQAHKPQLGFVSTGALQSALTAGCLLAASLGDELIGYIEYYVRRDGQVTVYSMAVKPTKQRQGIGAQLLAYLCDLATRRDLLYILLKCPIDNPANHFYDTLDFELIWVEQPVRGRALNIWRLPLTLAAHCGCL